jgi:hypothetical protein
MRRTILLIVALCFCASLTVAQFGGREGDVVIYLVSTKGSADIQVVAPSTVNTQTGFETKDMFALPRQPFGPDFPGESFALLHQESGDNFRMIVQKEAIFTQHNQFLGPAKLLIFEGIDRLVIPDKAPVDLTAGLFAPFPQGVDFGPEVPVFEAHSLLWTPSPVFPLLSPRDPSFISPIDPPGLTGSEYVLQLGSFLGIIPWVGLNKSDPAGGWAQGIDWKWIDQDASLGSTVRVMRIRAGRKTPPFRIPANTHLAVLSGSVRITPLNGSTSLLKTFHYAFVPNNFAITLSNPRQFKFESAGDDEAP